MGTGLSWEEHWVRPTPIRKCPQCGGTWLIRESEFLEGNRRGRHYVTTCGRVGCNWKHEADSTLVHVHPRTRDRTSKHEGGIA